MEKTCKNCTKPTEPKKSMCKECYTLSLQKKEPKQPVYCDTCQKPIPRSKFTTCKECFDAKKPKKEKKEKKENKIKFDTPKPLYSELNAEVKKLRFFNGLLERKIAGIVSGKTEGVCALCYIESEKEFCSTKPCLFYMYSNCATTICKNKAQGGIYCQVCQHVRDSMNMN